MYAPSTNPSGGKPELDQHRTDRPSEPRVSAKTASTDNTRGIVGNSPAIAAIKDLARSIGGRRSTVMINGETGTGKEMLARHIHDVSGRAAYAFVAVDCSALTETLVESQLFGHVRGAFTGASRDALGFIRSANHGTLFLDEVGELPLALQAKMLRVIQERVVVPVGSAQLFPVDIRIVCATHRDLADMVRRGTFRQDLYFRLNVIAVTVPPLRDRAADVLPLAEHFLRHQADLYSEATKRLTPDAQNALFQYSWPGNVRELANVIEQAHVLAETSDITVLDLPERFRLTTGADLYSDLLLSRIERRAIVEALVRTKNNKTAAARLLGVNVQKMTRRMEKLNIPLT